MRTGNGTGAGGHDVRALRLGGRLGASNGNGVRSELLAALAPGRTLVVDLAGVEAVEAAGAEIPATVRRQALALGGDLQLGGVRKPPILSAMPHGARAGGGMA